MATSFERRLAKLEDSTFRYQHDASLSAWMATLADEDVDLAASVADFIIDYGVDFNEALELANLTPEDVAKLEALDMSLAAFRAEKEAEFVSAYT